MNILILIMIVTGSVIMVSNIYRYRRFMNDLKDVLSGGSERNLLWEWIGLLLLIFFLIGYLGIAFFGKPDLLMAGILFGGSVFVAIIITLMVRLIDTTKNRSMDVAELLISVVEARDPNLNGHSRYVQNIVICFYHHLPDAITSDINFLSLQFAALLHDIGKMGIPESILNKPGRLDDEEWEVIRSHPKIGVQVLASLESFETIREWILYHHERMDGKGYYKMAKEDIPMGARIISVADTYATITMRRPYHKPITHEEALDEIKSVAGTQLDADLVKYFEKIPKEELIACAPETVEMNHGVIAPVKMTKDA